MARSREFCVSLDFRQQRRALGSKRTVLLGVLTFTLGCNEYEIIPEDVRETVRVEECPLITPAGYKPEETSDCVQEPEIGSFNPVVEWQWGENPKDSNSYRVEIPPMVANLTDDNGDGHIDAFDIPDIVVTTITGSDYKETGYVVALQGNSGEVLWSHDNYDDAEPWALGGPAIGDVDADGLPDIFVPSDKGLLRLTHDGKLVWLCDVPTAGGGQSMVTLADIDGDGTGEAIVNAAVCNHDGTLRWQASDNSARNYHGSIAADLDLDGFQEIIAGGTVFNHDGSIRWAQEDVTGIAAIGDLNNDGVPEIIVSTGYFGVCLLWVLDIDGNLLWKHKFTEKGAGAPTVADFDGDGFAEIGIASKHFYYVFEGDGSILWQRATEENSSGFTGSSVFDFEGDGAAEVVYADERTVWVLDGITSEPKLAYTNHGSGTRFEYPTIADVDGDGSAEILVGHGRGHPFGLTVLGSENNSWAPARPIWNQYAYSISNINDDGSIPAAPDPNWETHNNFRAGNAGSKVGLDLPDLAIGEPALCLTECTRGVISLSIPVENRGPQSITDDITVRVYATGDTILYEEAIPGMSEMSTYWIGPIDIDERDYGASGLRIELEGGSDDQEDILECDESNNVRHLPHNPCAGTEDT